MRNIIQVIGLTIGLLGCHPNVPFTQNRQSPLPQDFSYFLQSQKDLQVVNSHGDPLASAEVLIGQEVNANRGNFFVTDTNGNFRLPDSWQPGIPITINVPGYVRTTLYDLSTGQHQISLRLREPQQRPHARGRTKGFGRLERDGKVDFGIVLPQFNPFRLHHFRIASVLSPQFDSIKIFGKKIHIPSNITLPKQRETYIFPITLEKEGFRVFFPFDGQHKVLASHGRFPMKKVVDQIREGKHYFELINDFTFRQTSIADLSTASGKYYQLPVNTLQLNQKITIAAPSLSGDQNLLALGMSRNQDHFFPTDIKRLRSNERLDLHLPAAGDSWVFAAMTNDSASGSDNLEKDILAISTALVPGETATDLRFLSPIDPPHIGDEYFLGKAPVGDGHLTPVGTYLVLSDIHNIDGGKASYEQADPRWEFYTLGWEESLILPQWPGDETNMRTKSRWELIYLASDRQNINETLSYVDIGTQLFEKTTHATRNFRDN